jgi:hypothetical protein
VQNITGMCFYLSKYHLDITREEDCSNGRDTSRKKHSELLRRLDVQVQRYNTIKDEGTRARPYTLTAEMVKAQDLPWTYFGTDEHGNAPGDWLLSCPPCYLTWFAASHLM